ncbi:MAG: S9 family peptidase [Bacteroidetes bacterium]|nr:MAG: S9 family peptidase [Bacteroidota bacterium]
MLRPSVLLLLGCLLLPAAPSSAQDDPLPRTLTLDDAFALQVVGDPRISPDEQWVAYTIRTTDLDEDKTRTRIWMVPLGGGDPIPMTMEGASATTPRWSPDGRYLSFLAARGGNTTQVWALNRLGGEAQPLTDVEQGVSDYAWSPDGRRLALVIKDAEEAEDEDEKPRPYVIDRLQFKRDYAGYLDRRRTHIYVYDLQADSLWQVTSGDYDDRDPVWSPDGTRIAFVSNRTEEPDANDNTDLWIVPADAPDQGATLLQVTTNPGADHSPAWSPGGRFLTYVTVTQPEIIWYATSHLAVVPVQGGEARVLTTALDRNVSNPRFAPDGRSIFFELEDSGEAHLARIDPDGRNLRRPIQGGVSLRAYDVGPRGAVVGLVSRPDLPHELFRLEGDTLRQLTFTNQPLLDRIRLAEMRTIHFPSRDGTEIEGFLYTPPGYDPALRYPTLLRIHGGPVSQYDVAFNLEAQLFAAHGYVVVMTNPRGSSGYGQDFSLAIWADWGNKDFEDVMAGVDYAIEQGFADPDRLGVGGWSYGGILTNYVITRTDRFKAAITGASEVLYRSNYGHDHYQRQWEAELGLPWRNAEAWERISPFNAVENITTPTLIMGGALDWNVPILNSEQLYQALRRLGRTTRLVVYPGEHHGIRRPSFQKDRWERYLAWYDHYVKGTAPTDQPGSDD